MKDKSKPLLNASAVAILFAMAAAATPEEPTPSLAKVFVHLDAPFALDAAGRPNWQFGKLRTRLVEYRLVSHRRKDGRNVIWWVTGQGHLLINALNRHWAYAERHSVRGISRGTVKWRVANGSQLSLGIAWLMVDGDRCQQGDRFTLELSNATIIEADERDAISIFFRNGELLMLGVPGSQVATNLLPLLRA